MPVDDARTKEIFLDLLEVPAADRADLLARACSGDDDLRRNVEALLHAHDEAGALFAAPTSADPAPAPPPADEAGEFHEGDRIGDYRLLRVIGEGGFGTVYLAEQEHPVVRKVALKIIKPGMDSKQVIARFEVERQALALMDHPGIARVFDAGATETGRPYFVMEYVRGEPITEYCDARRLSIADRLDAFMQVCLAVQHAHQKGIIHRDLKPTNVLVTVVDGRPVPKVIDFGIAKATESTSDDQTALTLERQLLGTPAYMSPEQASLSGEDVDTRSDVYSLGILLYELLVGAPPFDNRRLHKAGLRDLERIIREEEPLRPSTRLGTKWDVVVDDESSVGDPAAVIAGRRRTDRTALSRQLRGELDWIVMRALEKDRERRYPTAYALAQDVERHLANEPVEASPPSRAYRLRKLARKHRLELGAATAVLTALIALVVFSLVFAGAAHRARKLAAAEADKARTEAAKFEAIAGFADEMLGGVDPAIARGADTDLMRQVLDDAARRVDEQFAGRFEVEVTLRNMIGRAYMSIAAFDEAEAQFAAATNLGHSYLGADDDLTLESEFNLAAIMMEGDRLPEASALLERVVSRRTDLHGLEHPKTLEVMGNLATLQRMRGQRDLAKNTYETLLAARREHDGPEHDDTLRTMNNLAVLYSEMDENTRARELYEQVVAVQISRLGDDHPNTLATMNNLANVMLEEDNTAEALPVLERVLEIKRGILEPGHPSIVITMVNLGSLYGQIDRFDEAEAMLTEAVEISREKSGPKHQRTLLIMNNLGALYANADRNDEALPYAEEVCAGLQESSAPDHPYAIMSCGHLAGIYNALERYDDALPIAEDATARAAAVFGADDWHYAACLRRVGDARAGRGEIDLARTALKAAHRILVADETAPPEQITRVEEALMALDGGS